ncbi:MAG TPA: hypothetical protein VHM29_11325 [Acidimicrobiia bacterium]|nr:hypothetical protein [Acidimicrobiia bacterium]
MSAPKVVEDARESPEPRGLKPPLGWLVVGLILGAGLTVLVLRPGPPEESVTSTTAIAGAGVEQGGIANVIEGFPDGLVAVTRSDGQSLELLIWPVRGEPIERTIPVGVSRPPDPVEFDVSARRIATLLPVPDQIDGVLYAGVPQDAAIVATDVTGFAWHDTTALQLAFSTFVDEELRLWVLRDNSRQPDLVARAVGIVGHVEAWGDWGFAIQDDTGDEIVLFTDLGEIKDTSTGRILDSDGTGWLAIENQGVSLLSSGGGVMGLGLDDIDGEVLAGRFSGDGQRLALLTSEQARVVSIENGVLPVESDARPGVPELAWSSDGRFVVYPGPVGMWVIDTFNGETEEILPNRTFTGLGMLPIADS